MNDPLSRNIDTAVAAGFGHEWSTFRQGERELSDADRQKIFNDYFSIFPWDRLKADSVGMDVGCGSGRWSVLVAPRVGHLHLLDASEAALAVARQNLAGANNVTFHRASVGEIPVADRSLDFAFSLGVLHHVPDTQAAIKAVAAKLKPGAPFLIYLYYALDNRPAWYRALWKLSNVFRIVISALPETPRLWISQIIAVTVYWPLARLAGLVEKLGFSASALPLEYYKDRDFYVMRTDAYDRFCTRLEQRFSRKQIDDMLSAAGFADIRFSESTPFWCAAGIKQ
ncbi:MAG: class I SAM-dependent methyltransferase [Afipia sp.]|nr:class I SAM-dependent methyltransferase [Afipia sp.]